MTCSECMEAVLVADLRRRPSEVGASEPALGGVEAIDAHTSTCQRCGRAVEIVRSAERDLSESLATSTTRLAAETVAATAHRRVRRERLVKWSVLPAIALVFAFASIFFANSMKSELKALVTPPPATETKTFSLVCLSGEQAAALLRPYLPSPLNPMWQAERFDVRAAGGGIRAVTVRAPRSTLKKVPALLARFEQDPQAACRVPPRGN